MGQRRSNRVKNIISASMQLVYDDENDDECMTDAEIKRNLESGKKRYMENKVEKITHMNGTHFFNSGTMDFPIRSKFIEKFGRDYSDVAFLNFDHLTYADIEERLHHFFGNDYDSSCIKMLSFEFDANELLDTDTQYKKRYDKIVSDPNSIEDTFVLLEDNSYIEIDETTSCIIYNKIPLGLTIHSLPFEECHRTIRFFYNASKEIDEKINDMVKSLFKLCREKADNVDDDFNSEFQLIVKTQKGFSTMSFDFDYEKYHNFDLSKNYNNDIIPVSDKIVKHLNKKKSSGITILHGSPGTGKTTYLRYLVSILKKDIIYLPPDMTNILSDPSIIDFMKSKSNSIFIIEDGEEVLKKRGENGNTTAVSNMLNVSDGLLADVLHFNFVITINCDIDQIDPALRRPGRLVAEYQFNKLTSDKSRNLLVELYPDLEIPHKVEPMSLAEIYTYDEDKFTHIKRKNGVGFTADIYG